MPDSRAAPTRRRVTGKEPRDAAAHKRALAGEHGGEPLAKKPCGPEARTTRDDALFTIGSTDPGNSLDCDWVLRELSAFEGASVAEASDDLGCALVSVNRVLETNGHPAFTADEVQRAHADAASAITTDASQERTAEEASAYIGNPEDGGAMSQAHVLRLFLNRFGEGEFKFTRSNTGALERAMRPRCSVFGRLVAVL